MSAGVDPALLGRVRDRLLGAGVPAGSAGPSGAALAAALRSEVGQLCGDTELLGALDGVRRELTGAGPLEALLADPLTTDVLVNGPDSVWVDRGRGPERTGVRFRDEGAVRRLAVRLVAPTGRRLDDAHPYVDARLPDGTRLHAVLPPVAPGGTCLSLRVARRDALTLDQLVERGALGPAGAAVLTALVTARLALLVTGGTGTGKTTLLSALLSRADPRERLVLVEDSGELRPQHPHVVRLEARPANLEGAGAVGLTDLVRQALRMRPDRLVVGEVRGAEVVDLLLALNTGHEGGCATLHANGAAEVPARLEALGGLAGLGRAALHSQAAAALQAVVHLARGGDGVRRVTEVRVAEARPDGTLQCTPALRLHPQGVEAVGGGAGRLAALCEARGVALPPPVARTGA